MGRVYIYLSLFRIRGLLSILEEVRSFMKYDLLVSVVAEPLGERKHTNSLLEYLT